MRAADVSGRCAPMVATAQRLTRTGQGGSSGGERHEGFGPPAADEEYALAPQEGGVVEGAGVLEAARARELELQRARAGLRRPAAVSP